MILAGTLISLYVQWLGRLFLGFKFFNFYILFTYLFFVSPGGGGVGDGVEEGVSEKRIFLGHEDYCQHLTGLILGVISMS